MTQPKIIIIAGPNDAGKTTFEWVLYDNSGDEPVLVDWSDKP